MNMVIADFAYVSMMILNIPVLRENAELNVMRILTVRVPKMDVTELTGMNTLNTVCARMIVCVTWMKPHVMDPASQL